MWKICSFWHNQAELKINLGNKKLQVFGLPLMKKREMATKSYAIEFS